MSRFSTWFQEKYEAWRKTQTGKSTYSSYADYLGANHNTLLDFLLEIAPPADSDLMAIAAREGLEVYDTVGQKRPPAGVIEVFDSLQHMRGNLRVRMAHAIYEAEQEVKSKHLPIDSKAADRIYIAAFTRWGFHYIGNTQRPDSKTHIEQGR